jgi:hypothetical protein
VDGDWLLLTWLQPIVVVGESIEESGLVVACIVRRTVGASFGLGPVET